MLRGPDDSDQLAFVAAAQECIDTGLGLATTYRSMAAGGSITVAAGSAT